MISIHDSSFQLISLIRFELQFGSLRWSSSLSSEIILLCQREMGTLNRAKPSIFFAAQKAQASSPEISKSALSVLFLILAKVKLHSKRKYFIYTVCVCVYFWRLFLRPTQIYCHSGIKRQLKLCNFPILLIWRFYSMFNALLNKHTRDCRCKYKISKATIKLKNKRFRCFLKEKKLEAVCVGHSIFLFALSNRNKFKIKQKNANTSNPQKFYFSKSSDILCVQQARLYNKYLTVYNWR